MADNAGARTARKNKDDLVKESQAMIKSHESAKKWLTENDLVLKNEDPTMSTMATALYQLCSGRFHQPKDMVTGMRAIAICMEEIIQTRHTTIALDTVKEQVEDIIKEAKDAIGELVGEVKTAMNETEERMKNHGGGGRNEDVEKIIEKAVQSATKPTYAQALSATHGDREERREQQIRNDTIIRGEIQRKQIILDGDDATKEQTAKLTPKELVLKANLALDKLESDLADTSTEDTNEKPTGTKFLAARLLKNGGVLFEMDSEDGANWLKQDEVTKAFENCFPRTVKIKGNNYQVVVQFLPIRLKNRLEDLLTEIEKENNLIKGSIVSAKWLRNPANWNPTQTKVHAVLAIKHRNEANNIISKGMLIDGARHDARKLEEDPKRCFKCQLVGTGHTATTCKSKEICANCAKEHPTGECQATRAEFKCATCKKDKRQDDHAAWDRQCPAFIEEKARLRMRKPENHYRFYPGEYETWTWVRNDDSLAEGYTDRWMGNDARRGPQQPRDERRDNGWGKPLGRDTTARTGDTWVIGDSYRPSNQRYRSNDRERSRDRNAAPRNLQRRDDRSRSRGRPTQQQTQTDRDPRQRSLIKWVTTSNKSRERGGRDPAPPARIRQDDEYRSSQTSRR